MWVARLLEDEEAPGGLRVLWFVHGDVLWMLNEIEERQVGSLYCLLWNRIGYQISQRCCASQALDGDAISMFFSPQLELE